MRTEDQNPGSLGWGVVKARNVCYRTNAANQAAAGLRAVRALANRPRASKRLQRFCYPFKVSVCHRRLDGSPTREPEP